MFRLDKSHIKQKGNILRDSDEGAFCGLCQGSFRRRSCYAGGAKRETIKSWQIEIQRPASPFLTVTTIQVIQTSFPDKQQNYRLPFCAVSNDYFKGKASKITIQNLSIKEKGVHKGGTGSIFLTRKKTIPGESPLQHPSNFSGSRTDHFKPNQPAQWIRREGPWRPKCPQPDN